MATFEDRGMALMGFPSRQKTRTIHLLAVIDQVETLDRSSSMARDRQLG